MKTDHRLKTERQLEEVEQKKAELRAKTHNLKNASEDELREHENLEKKRMELKNTLVKLGADLE